MCPVFNNNYIIFFILLMNVFCYFCLLIIYSTDVLLSGNAGFSHILQ